MLPLSLHPACALQGGWAVELAPEEHGALLHLEVEGFAFLILSRDRSTGVPQLVVQLAKTTAI